MAASNPFQQFSKLNLPIGGLLSVTALLGLMGYGAMNSIYVVSPGHKAILYNRLGGLEAGVVSEGMHFRVPWLQRPIIFDVRTRPENISSMTGSKDLQMVNMNLRVLFKPDDSDLQFIYRRLGTDFDQRVLPSIANEVAKQVVARYNAAELLTKREVVSMEIRNDLTKRASDFKILLEDVSITHLSFSKEYTAAVEAKQVAQQESERAKYIVDKAIQEKEAIVIRAKGEAESAKLIGNAIRDNPSFVQLRRIAAAKEIADTIAESGNKIYLNSDSLLLNVMDDSITGAVGNVEQK